MLYCLSDDMPRVRDNCIKTIRQLEGSWDVAITPHQTPKTTHQRGWFHKLCGILGDEVGLTLGQVKEIVKGYELGWKLVRLPGGIEFPVADGSSEDLDRLGYAKLTDTLYRLGTEMDVALPPPDPRLRKRG